MPDRRTHRGPHPDDLRWFAPEACAVLRVATADLAWLLGRGYAHDSSLKLVGDRYGLAARQRIAVARCAAGEATVAARQGRQVSAEMLAGRALWLDGYNVLTTVEAALAGGVLLAACDGTFRDMASMHGSYRKVAETRPALELIGRVLADLQVSEALWLMDRPVGNSGRLRQFIEAIAAAAGWPWRVELVADPDPLLAASPEIVATADSVILDRCPRWFNLAREVVGGHVPGAWVVELGVGRVATS